MGRNLRQVADALAKGKLAITIGLGRTEFEPFLNAGLPIKELPTPTEGLPASSGYGVLGIVKNPPHPNAMKVFVNWFLSRKGQMALQKLGDPDEPPNSARIDIPKDDVLPQHKLIEGRRYFDVTRADFEDLDVAFKVAAQAMESR